MRNLLTTILLSYRALPKRERVFFWAIILISTLVLFPTIISINNKNKQAAADMYFLLPTPTIGVGQPFSVELRVKTNGQPINAVESVIHFNPVYLEIVNMTTEKSFCSYYPDKSFDTIRGEIHISCGLPNPGFQGDSVVVHLNMRAKLVGISKITVDGPTASVLANDGKGTNILKKAPEISITVNQIF
jgi:hypothetical protein